MGNKEGTRIAPQDATLGGRTLLWKGCAAAVDALLRGDGDDQTGIEPGAFSWICAFAALEVTPCPNGDRCRDHAELDRLLRRLLSVPTLKRAPFAHVESVLGERTQVLWARLGRVALERLEDSVESPDQLSPACSDDDPLPCLTGRLSTWYPRAGIEHALVLTGLGPLTRLLTRPIFWAARLQRTASLQFETGGLRLESQWTLRGTPVRTRTTWLPSGSIQRIQFDQQRSIFALLVGLSTLCIGSYLGLTWVADGSLGTSWSGKLIGLGLGLVAVSAVLDFVVRRGVRGSRAGRLKIVSADGSRWCLVGIDQASAAAVLRALAAPSWVPPSVSKDASSMESPPTTGKASSPAPA